MTGNGEPIGKPRTEIAAHRGGAGLWPENSMTAFENTTRLDVDLVEFDVHPTRDGRLVVHHDPLLDRMTDGAGPLNEKTFAELSELTIKGTDDGRIPLLSEVIEVFRPTPIALRIEIKADANLRPYPGLEAAVAAEIDPLGMMERTVITSFFIDTLVRFRAVARPQNMIWLVKKLVFAQIGGMGTVLKIAKIKEIEEIALHQSVVGPEEAQAARAAGVRLGAFAVNDEAAIRRMLDLGVTVFTSDRPDIAIGMRDHIQGR
ncbi:MAG: hypothetical protein HN403_08905 [Rhodospirillales bacterium]|jgi:glycerophosphoryl diester phosphodiesterase|nr:hypothetical protein [Rhodospirillales bacterium]